ncbi:MAG: FAD-dependent pyridine nucleotide-disulfide oxidoreductase [Frankiales bacterium]|jgi:NADPH-dependent 2,4-dienoyl-CoA reductase/sulfur reductase-like enzyme|nr:FAD-dependent pyridine nucleotide-disulfide oxidoreductase [Frankiales bacterium]
MAPRQVVVVGAGPGGLRTVEQLRKKGYDGALTVVGDEPHAPYDRPALSKQVLLGKAEPTALALRGAEQLAALGADFRLGRRAVSLDVPEARLELDDGDTLRFDALVLATGCGARRLQIGAGLAGVHYLRSLDDAVAVRAALATARRIVVVGGGFIGCEVAAAARALGLEVTLVEAAAAPLAPILGGRVGELVTQLHVERGVTVRSGTGVAGIDGGTRVESVRLSDGSEVAADVVVLGVGTQPSTDWLAGSGLTLDNGVLCDRHCSAGTGVFAVGDVARWYNPLFDEVMRIEHWTNAAEQAAVVAANVQAYLAGGAGAPLADYAPVPYFWSDQYDTRIQFAGRTRAGDDVHLLPPAGDGRERVALYGREERLVGALAMNSPRSLLRYRQAIGARASWDSTLDELAGVGA